MSFSNFLYFIKPPVANHEQEEQSHQEISDEQLDVPSAVFEEHRGRSSDLDGGWVKGGDLRLRRSNELAHSFLELEASVGPNSNDSKD
eukprot:CAMPEP_0170499312 /NCGR_PEP_ID=MMETSP0208-20121228/30925_1 /TAXON_ID=197538 /ORGANISM="Strombidium inclinatum, Strain S3" /LENGTH=87 /DNA_ID=CAMNT_0010776821 /DNA_START=285 /DNA_END=548 /DNA_ORIENTATION=+